MQMKKIPIYILFILLIFSACDLNHHKDRYSEFSVNHDQFILNNDIYDIKGVVYVPSYPGYMPQDIELMDTLPELLYDRFYDDLTDIKAMGANTVRLWGAPADCYRMIDQIGGLTIFQTIWINTDVSDLQDQSFKASTIQYIQTVIDRVHSGFTGGDPPLLAFIVGNEISEATITSTDQLHPNITSYHGEYIKVNGISASEAFLAEMGDYVKSYSLEFYGKIPLVSYANDIRTTYLIDTPFFDFRCQNAYSYAVPYYRWGTLPGSSSGTQFQGWLEEVKSIYPDVPLLISETGLSVSPNAVSAGPPNYSYGGNSEDEQAQGILQNLNDISTAAYPLAGVCIHEFLDSWWKHGREDSETQDPDDVEEWFGLVKFELSGDRYTTSFRPAYLELKTRWSQ
jgi:hypothetical protein